MIYYLEDDASIRDLVLYTLRSAGFETEGSETPGEFFSLFQPERAELVMLDIMLPGESGLSVLSRLRADARSADVPVIMVTAMGLERDKVEGLDMGADDYIAKPFGMMELLARVRALLRRVSPAQSAAALKIGSVTLDDAAHRVTVEGRETELTYKEYELLKYLMESRGTVRDRDEILNRVWGIDCRMETRTVDVHMRTLRRKLGPEGDIISTVRGVGYVAGRRA